MIPARPLPPSQTQVVLDQAIVVSGKEEAQIENLTGLWFDRIQEYAARNRGETVDRLENARVLSVRVRHRIIHGEELQNRRR
jgi:hypothetical protein